MNTSENTLLDNFTFYELCRKHLFSEALYMIEQNPSIINRIDITQCNNLSFAVSFRDKELIEFLIENGAHIKNCSLMICAMNPNNFQGTRYKYNQWNRLEMIRYLIELGCSVTEGIVSFITDNYTPIMACCHLPESNPPSDNLNICKLFLINGANIRDIDNTHQPLNYKLMEFFSHFIWYVS